MSATKAITKPTILLVPGAWHPKETFEPLAERIEGLKVTAQATQLRSVGSSATISQDGAALKATLEKSFEDASSDMIVVAHSYAGAALAPILPEVSKWARERQGKTGGVVGIVYLAAYVLPEGAKLLEGAHPSWLVTDEEKETMTVEDPIWLFYGDLPIDQAKHYASLLQPHSMHAVREPVGYPGFTDSAYDGRRAYILTEDDAGMSEAVQRSMLKESGVDWEIWPIKSAHSPMLNRIDEVAKYLVGLAKRWEA